MHVLKPVETKTNHPSYGTAAKANPFICVTCYEPALQPAKEGLRCNACELVYPIINGIPILLPLSEREKLATTVDDHLVSLDEVQQVYDRAYQHDGIMGTDLDKQYDKVTKQTLMRFAEPLAGKRVLDIGTGVGNLWDYMPLNVEGYALEVSRVGMTKAIQRHPHLTGSVSVAEYLPYPDAFFDMVIAADTMEHTFDPTRSLTEIWRVLKPGGVFSASLPVCNSLRKWGWNRLVRQPWQLGLVARLGWILIRRTLLFGNPTFQPIDRDKDAQEWVKLMEEANLTVVKVLEWPEPPRIPITYLIHAVKE